MQIKNIVVMEMIMLFIRRFQLKKKETEEGEIKRKRKESKETNSKILFDFQQCLDHKNIRRKEKTATTTTSTTTKQTKKNEQEILKSFIKLKIKLL